MVRASLFCRVMLSLSSVYYIPFILTGESCCGCLIYASKCFEPLKLSFEWQLPGWLPIGDIRHCWDGKHQHLDTLNIHTLAHIVAAEVLPLFQLVVG